MSEVTSEDEALKAARAASAKLSASLPTSIDLGAACQRYKTAGKAHMLREALIWREEELARNAIDAFGRLDLVTAAILTRAAMETSALLMHLFRRVSAGITNGVTIALDQELTNLLTGSKAWEETRGAVNVLTLIDKVEKYVPGYRSTYDGLSEVAHPNWAGVHGSYASIDKATLIVRLSRGAGQPGRPTTISANALAGALQLFVAYYDEVGDLIAPFADACRASFSKMTSD